jgi:hypothetical protein
VFTGWGYREGQLSVSSHGVLTVGYGAEHGRVRCVQDEDTEKANSLECRGTAHRRVRCRCTVGYSECEDRFQRGVPCLGNRKKSP